MADSERQGDDQDRSWRSRGDRDRGEGRGPSRDESRRPGKRWEPVWREGGQREETASNQDPDSERPTRERPESSDRDSEARRNLSERLNRREPSDRPTSRGREGADREGGARRDAGERGERSFGERSFGERPERPFRSREGGDRPFGERSSGWREGGDRESSGRRDAGGPPRWSGERPERRTEGRPEGRRDEGREAPRRDYEGRSSDRRGGDFDRREGGERRERSVREFHPRDDSRREMGRRDYVPRGPRAPRDMESGEEGGERHERESYGGREGRPMRGVGYAPRGGGFRPKGPRPPAKKKKKVRVYFHQALTRILLPKLLTKAKYLSPALARQFIEAGRVRVNARIVSSRYYEVNLRKERVTIDEAPTEYPRRLSYMVYNKPRGVLCEKGDPAFDAIFEPTSTWSFPFGRLSKAVSGLVILSNDPRMATRQHMTDVELQKEYRIRINKHLTDQQLEELRNGILVGDDYLVPLKVTVGNKNTNSMWIDLTLLDDSYHRIYSALKALGAEVVKMRRMRIGLLNENMVPPGEWRELSGFEITALDLARFMPGELPPEPLPPPRPRPEKGKGDRRFSKDMKGGPRRGGWGPPGGGKKGFPGKRREEDPDEREERLRQEALADAIGNR